jgi:hypothetical protein
MDKLAIAGGGTEQITNPALSPTIQQWSGEQFLQTLLPNLITLGFIIGVIIFFFVLLIGAIQWMSSGGDKAGLEQARGKVVSGLVGIIILFSLYAIIVLVSNFFGLDILSLDIGALKIR